MSFNTGNHLPSKDILDLYDNSENIDHFANSQEDEHPDRFGTKRLTLAGLIKRSMALRNEINDFSGALTFKPEWTDVPMNVSVGVGGEGGALNLQAEALGNRSEINKVTSREALRRSYAEAGLHLVDGSFEEGGALLVASDVMLTASGAGYSWAGPEFPHNVAKGTDPTVVGSDYVPRTDTGLRGELLNGALSVRNGIFALRDIMSIADYCVTGDGIREGTVDATSIFQQAVNELHAIGGGILYIPQGTYIIRSVDIYSNIHLQGAGWATILKHPVGYNGRQQTPDVTWPWEVDGMFTANYGGLAGTPNLADNIKDISFRDIWFQGTSVEDGFLETMNLLCLTAVSNVSITGCKFTGFRGDAIDFPTGSILHGDNARHCSNLYIAHNYFDGLNYNNRQCISIYDCVGAVIENNYMTRCTHATMPGAIDLEPGGAIDPSMLNITIRNNRFVDIGVAQNKPGIACLLSEITNQEKFGNIRIYDNYMSKCSGLQLLGINAATDILQYKIIDVSNNIFVGVYRGLVTYGLHGIEFTNNKFESTTDAMLIGYAGVSGNLIFRGNTFQYCASVDGHTMLLYTVHGLKLIDNTFIDCGKTDGTLGDVLYSLGGAPVTGLEIISNTFWHNGPEMHQVLRNADGAVDASTLLIEDNKLTGDVVIGFPQRSHSTGVYTGAPNGEVVNLFKLEPGTYYIAVQISGDAANFGATATVVVGTSSARITTNNTSFVALAEAAGFITASQISGRNQDIHWQYSKL